MRRRALAAALLAASGAGAAAAQAFPGEEARPPAFPLAVIVSGSAVWSDDRAVRTYDVGQPNPNDPACDTIRCRTTLGASSSLALGARLQVPLSRIAGLRAGVAIARTSPRIATLDGSQERVGDERITVLRGDAMVLVRFKAQAPVFFGVGAAFARFSPGLAPDQDASTDVGGVLAVGYDHRVNRSVGVRVEWMGYFLVPPTSGWPPEYTPESSTIDHQIGIGLTYYLGKAAS